MNKTLLVLNLICILIFSVSGTKKWVSTPVSNFISTDLNPAINTPWFSDNTDMYTCSGAVESVNVVPTQGSYIMLNKTSITGLVQGGKNTALCMNITDAEGGIHSLALKLNYVATVHDFEFKWQCGNMKSFQSTSLSCHCPMGLSNAEFSPCPPMEDITFQTSGVRGLQGNNNNTLRLCHNLRSRGTSKGCWLKGGGTTDFYSKFFTNWDFFPAFKLKPRTYSETLWTLFVNGVETANFSLSALDPVKKDSPLGFMNIALTQENVPIEDLSDLVFVSKNGSFSDVDQVYAIDSYKFNEEFEYDPTKLCSMKYGIDGKLDLRKNIMDEAFKSTSVLENCYSAKGVVGDPFPSLLKDMNFASKISSKLDPSTFAIFPGETSLMKVETQGSFGVELMFDNEYKITSMIETNAVTHFSYSCESSQNQDGFRCHLAVDVDKKGQVYIQSQDAGFILANYNAHPGKNTFDVLVNPLYTSAEKLTLCAGATWQDSLICSTHKLTYNITDDDDQPINENPEDTNGDDLSGFGKNSDGLQAWVIVLIVIACIIFVVLVLYFCFPCFRFAFHLIKKCTKTLRHKVDDLNQKVISQDEESLVTEGFLNEPATTAPQATSTVRPPKFNTFNKMKK